MEAKADAGMKDATVAVAESLTGGLLMGRIVAIPESGSWFTGGVVAYDSRVKYDLLKVAEGPVITEAAAIQMAIGVRQLLDTAIGIATTGVAGPEEDEGQLVGTVFLGLATSDVERALELHIDGDPETVRAAAVKRGLEEVERMRSELVAG